MRIPTLLTLCLPLLLCLGCQKDKTPQDACARLLRAVESGDGGAVFDSLVQTTQWSLHTVARYQGKMRDVIERSYPAAERGKALARLPVASGGRAYFAILYPRRYEKELVRRLGQGAVVVQETDADHALCGRGGAAPFRLARASSGRWGLAELDSEWELAKIRVVHDLDTVTENARLYDRAGPANRSP